MKRIGLIKIAAGTLLLAALLPAAIPAQAVSTAIGIFYGGCGSFSVDVAVSGTQDDGGGIDRMRYNVTDGNNTVLYREDVNIKVGTYVASQVFNLPYMNGLGPAKNPVRFAVVQLDGNGNTQHEVGFVTFDAPCLGGSGSANRSGNFTPDGRVNGAALYNANLYQTPGGGILPLTIKQGFGYIAVYRTPDASWVQIFIGSNDLLWVPANSLQIDPWQLALRPSHIFGSNLGVGANADQVAVNSAPVAAGVTTSANVRMRSGPGVGFGVVGSLPRNTAITVSARNSTGAWIKVTGNGVTGWINSFYTNMTSAAIRSLPVATS